jgi:ribonuclease BN (tRNA processing enzyme)
LNKTISSVRLIAFQVTIPFEKVTTPMKVICLGTGGFHCTEESHTACYFLPELGIVFDAGSGFFRTTPRIITPTLDIFLSHGHADHTCGIHVLQETIEQTQAKTIRIHAEPHVLTSVERSFHDPVFPVQPPIEYVPLSGDKITFESGAVVTYFHVKHTTSCIGYRLDYLGKSFAYVTDTASYEDSEYIKNVRGVDLLFHVVWADAGVDVSKNGHTDAGNLIKFCSAAGITNLVTIHHKPGLDREIPLATLKKAIPNARAAHDLEEFSI